MMIKRFLMTAALALTAAGSAGAATLSINGGTAGTIPSAGQTNDVLNGLGMSVPLSGYFEASIGANLGAKDKVLVEVMGYEAGFKNTFTAGSGSFTSAPGKLVAANMTSPLARWTTTSTSGGLLSFLFQTTGTVPRVLDSDVANGDANLNTAQYANFFSHQDTNGRIWLFFDDGGGNDDDDNHDDLVVRLSAVPLPAGLIPLLTGLAGFGAVGLRRRRKSA